MEKSFEKLPENVSRPYHEILELKNLIKKLQDDTTLKDEWLDLHELCEYLPDRPAKATVYGWVHRNSIPFHKGGKKLRFLKSEIDNWLKGESQNQGIDNSIYQYLKRRR